MRIVNQIPGNYLSFGIPNEVIFANGVDLPATYDAILTSRAYLPPHLLAMARDWGLMVIWSTQARRGDAIGQVQPLAGSPGTFYQNWKRYNPMAWIQSPGSDVTSARRTYLHEFGHFLDTYHPNQPKQAYPNDQLASPKHSLNTTYVDWHTTKIVPNTSVPEYYRLDTSAQGGNTNGRAEFWAEAFEEWVSGDSVLTPAILGVDYAYIMNYFTTLLGPRPKGTQITSSSFMEVPASGIGSGITSLTVNSQGNHLTITQLAITGPLAFARLSLSHNATTRMDIEISPLIPATNQDGDGNDPEGIFFGGATKGVKEAHVLEPGKSLDIDFTPLINQISSKDPGWGSGRTMMFSVKSSSGSAVVNLTQLVPLKGPRITARLFA